MVAENWVKFNRIEYAFNLKTLASGTPNASLDSTKPLCSLRSYEPISKCVSIAVKRTDYCIVRAPYRRAEVLEPMPIDSANDFDYTLSSARTNLHPNATAISMGLWCELPKKWVIGFWTVGLSPCLLVIYNKSFECLSNLGQLNS